MIRDLFPRLMTHPASALTPMKVAAVAILIAASNNLVKEIHAYSSADRKTGVQSLALLTALAAMGLPPLLWLGV